MTEMGIDAMKKPQYNSIVDCYRSKFNEALCSLFEGSPP